MKKLQWIAILAALPLAGCAATHSASTTTATRSVAPDPNLGVLQGTWDLVHRASGSSAPTADRHELQLQLHEGSLIGVWDRGQEWQAPSGKSFANGNPQCLERRRFFVSVAHRGGKSLLQVDRELPRTDAGCGAALSLVGPYRLRLEGRQLVVDGEGLPTLRFNRRRHASVPLAILLHGHGRLTGVWTWHHRSLDKEGDLKIEQETWHLFQQGKKVEGYYDRVVAIRSRDGRRFVCNNDSGYSNRARFLVRGKVRGNEFVLEEVSYVIHPGDCDTGQRTLDRYVGMVDTKGSQILLRWRSGGQILQRRH